MSVWTFTAGLWSDATRAVFFDSFSGGSDTCQMLFRALKNYDIGMDVLAKTIRIFDENIKELTRVDDRRGFCYYLFVFLCSCAGVKNPRCQADT